VFEVVGVLPNVDAVDRGPAGHQGGVLVGKGFDKKSSVFTTTEPSPSASEDAHGAFGHLFLPLSITSESIVDLLS